MERTLIVNLRQSVGQKVKIQGWLQTLRDQKKMQFLIMRDHTGLVQVAFWKQDNLKMAEKISVLGVESALTITGTVVDNPVVKFGWLGVAIGRIGD